MVEYVSLLLLAATSLPKIKISFKHTNYLSLDNSTYIRGLLCLLIFLNHFSSWFDNQGVVFYLFSHLGSFVVGIFFFLSGFGLMKAYPEEIKITFLIKRFLKLFIPYWLCELVYSAISLCFNIPLQVDVSLKNIVLSAIRMSEIVENSWYVSASLVLYIAFFIAKKVLPRCKTSLKITVLLLVFSLASHCGYWTTFFAFPLGVLFCEKEKEINSLKNGRKIVCAVISLLLCCMAIALKYYGYNIDSSLYMNLSDFVTSVTFAALVYFLFCYIHIGNRILGFLGKISYEFYLLHGLCIRIAYKTVGIDNGIPFLLVSIAFTIVLSYVISFISSRILNPIVKRI